MAHQIRTEIISVILEAANGHGEDGEGITFPKLTYNVDSADIHLEEYLVFLIDDDLLSCDSTMSTFKTTEKGLLFLQAYNEIDKMLKE
jgi:predicted transcriptional regulator